MAETHNVVIPHGLLRLGIENVEDLIVMGLDGPVTLDTISDLLDRQYPNRRRAARAILRLVSEDDVIAFNHGLMGLRRRGVTNGSSYTIICSYRRGICTIRF